MVLMDIGAKQFIIQMSISYRPRILSRTPTHYDLYIARSAKVILIPVKPLSKLALASIYPLTIVMDPHRCSWHSLSTTKILLAISLKKRLQLWGSSATVSKWGLSVTKDILPFTLPPEERRKLASYDYCWPKIGKLGVRPFEGQ